MGISTGSVWSSATKTATAVIFVVPAAAAVVGAGGRGDGGGGVGAGPLVGEEAEAVDGVDDEEGDPEVEGDARHDGEEDPRLPVGFPVVKFFNVDGWS